MDYNHYAIHNIVFGVLYNNRRKDQISLSRILESYGKKKDYECDLVMSEFERLGLIEVIDHEYYTVKISEKGKEVYVEHGMVDRYIDHIRKEEYQKENYKNLELKSLELDVKLKTWQKKIFWWIFMLGIIGGVTGSVALFLELQDRYSLQQKELQKKQTTSTNKVSHQTKMGD